MDAITPPAAMPNGRSDRTPARTQTPNRKTTISDVPEAIRYRRRRMFCSRSSLGNTDNGVTDWLGRINALPWGNSPRLESSSEENCPGERRQQSECRQRHPDVIDALRAPPRLTAAGIQPSRIFTCAVQSPEGILTHHRGESNQDSRCFGDFTSFRRLDPRSIRRSRRPVSKGSASRRAGSERLVLTKR